MEGKKKLYPMTFRPVTVRHSWGEETVALADLGIEDSVVSDGWLEDNSIGEIMETYLERITGEDVYGYYGRQFPVTVKFLDIRGEMPVHVHPDDEVAEQRYDALGGKEFWYVTEAGKDAEIRLGFSREMTAQELFDRSADGTLKEVMNVLHPVKGDFLTISPGIVHCAGNGLKVTVIKQASELPFRLSGPDDDGNCDNGDFVAEAMDFISYARYDTAEARMKADDMPGIAGERLAGCAEFNISRLRLQAPVKIHSQEQNGYAVYVCIEGEASVQARVAAVDGKDTEAAFPLGKGTAMLVPAEVTDFILLPADRQTTLLEVTPGTREDIDGYINPDTEPFLEGEDYEGLENDDVKENDNVKEEGKHNRNWN